MSKLYCCYVNCRNFRIAGKRYCEKHKHLEYDPTKRKPFIGAKRSNEGLYNTARWKKLRAYILKRDGCCYKCGSIEKLQVHHKIAARNDEELFFNPANCVCICFSCHSKETRREICERNDWHLQNN